MLEDDIQRIELMTSNICNFVDKNIAHLEEYVIDKNLDETIEFSMIQESVDLLGNISEKYLLLFNDKIIDKEALDYVGWQDCFRFPWKT